ncbi:MAG: DEAD/DEAH box helicase [Pseudomonadota bacterium]
MHYTFEDLQDQFSAELLDAADFSIEQGLVAHPDIRQDGRLITSLLQAPGHRPYRVYIRIDTDHGPAPVIRGECSCGVRGNCEHVAAVLLRALGDEEGLQGEALELALHGKVPETVAQDHYPDDVKQRLLYLLFPELGGEKSVGLQTVSARQLKAGGFGSLRDYQPEWALRGRPPRFLLEVDRQLLAELDKIETTPWSGERQLEGPGGEQILQRVLETGRCYLGEVDVALRPGKTRKVSFRWEVDEEGFQHPRFEFDPPTPTHLLLHDLWYIDPENGECGKLETGFPRSLLEALFVWLDGVPPEDARQLNQTLSKLTQKATLPTLREFQQIEQDVMSPVPCLRLSSQFDEMPWGEDWLEEVQLSFEYAGRCFTANQPSQWIEGDRLVRVKRDKDEEEAAADRLLGWGFQTIDLFDANLGAFTLDDGPEAWFDFQADLLPQLRREGWRIEFDDSFRFRLLEVEKWYGSLQPKRDTDWFRVGLGVEVEGERINLLPGLVKVLREFPKTLNRKQLQELDPEQMLIIPLDDQRLVPVPLEKIRLILDTLFELYQDGSLDEEGQLPLSRIQLARLAELSTGDDSLQIDDVEFDTLHNLIQRLRGLEQLPEVKPPQGLQASLRDYQQQGLAWLQFLRENELGGVLADDMGLGKTVQTLAHLLLEKEQGRLDRPALVVAPTSLLVNWRREARQFTPDLKVMILHGLKRRDRFKEIPENDLVITSYPLLARDRELLLKQEFHLLILDEAQNIKNPKTQASRVVRELNAQHRLCLTGTPLENHLGELWSQFDFLLPGLLGSDKQFRRAIRNPIEKQGDESAAERLALRLRPFMLRRTKQEVARELPPKTEILRTVELQGAQRELYETIRLAMHEQVRKAVAEQGWGRSHIMVLDALLKLRQVCCDPRLVKLEDARKVKHSAKLELLMELLPEMIEEGRRVLLFSQFTGMLSLIEEAVKKAGIDYVKLTGRTRDRAKPVDSFQNGEAPLFLISLKAGGTGLNLTAADTVIHYDPWWNPAVERQATDRAHRIGQENPVFVYKLISEGTVEERIQLMQAQKQALADSLFEKRGPSQAGWSETELELLFGPLE